MPLQVMARRAFVPVAWLRAEAEAGRIPHLQAGKKLLFDPKTVERVLLERAQETEQEAESGSHGAEQGHSDPASGGTK